MSNKQQTEFRDCSPNRRYLRRNEIEHFSSHCWTYRAYDSVDGLDVTLNISVPGKIETFVVHVSENFQPLVSIITTGNVPYLDLINDQAVIDMLKGAIPALADGLYGQTDVTFSLSSLIQLITSVGTPGQDYVFTLSLTDQLGQELPEQPLTFHLPETTSSAE